MASFKAKFPVLQELFAKNHRGGPLAPPPAGRGLSTKLVGCHTVKESKLFRIGPRLFIYFYLFIYCNANRQVQPLTGEVKK